MLPAILAKQAVQPYGYLKDRQSRIAVVMPSANLDLRLELISCPDRNRPRKNMALPGLLRCPSVQRTVWAAFVEPGFEVVEPALDASLRQARSGSIHDAQGHRNSRHRRKFQMLNGPMPDSLGHYSLLQT